MSTRPIVIDEENLSRAWARAFLRVLKERSPANEAPLVISISEFDELGEPKEDLRISRALKEAIIAVNREEGRGQPGHKSAVQTVSGTAQTIFPHMCWTPRDRVPAEQLFRHYLENVFPRLQTRCTKNNKGTYFERMLRVPGWTGDPADKPGESHQLPEILRWFKEHKKPPINSSTQISIYNPAKDCNGSALKGFPCLQQVSIRRDRQGDTDELSLTAYYPTEYIFERGYGNYLGLCRLANFLAHELGFKLVAVNAFINQPMIEANKTGALAVLVKQLEAMLADTPSAGTGA